MHVFPKAIVLITKLCFDIKRTYCVIVRLDGEVNREKDYINTRANVFRFIKVSGFLVF